MTEVLVVLGVLGLGWYLAGVARELFTLVLLVELIRSLI